MFVQRCCLPVRFWPGQYPAELPPAPLSKNEKSMTMTSPDDAAVLSRRLRHAINLLLEDGLDRAQIGAAMVGIGAGLVHANAPESIDLMIQGIRDACDADGKPAH